MEKEKAGGWQEIPANRLLSTKEAADVLNTSEKMINQMINAGMLIPIYYGKKRCLPVSMLNAFIAERIGHDLIADVSAAEASR